MREYTVVAKDNLILDGDFHTWTKGEKYIVTQADSHIKIRTNQGRINYANEVKDQVLEQFVIVK